ncbi:enoyl-CoA hydratase/isomerase family protein [Sneathiella sp.]|uniref:enoyl-CoA hydratase/isomerase family protein n=1 Tax=Sneathiella sp. TaxID=1964365 RepID=UPI00260F27EC|nr:enoyl-CoA hydratase/isomerase family protein [Sneathiella sp.]MDF2366701.1 enoyl-CoA hydratase/isomerase family protein [Sneathiella sp.]
MAQLTLDRQGNIGIIRFSNPPQGYMDGETEGELEVALTEVEGDPEIRVVVLTGADEDVFIRHYDVGVLYERSKAMAARGLTFDPARPVPESLIHKCYRRIEAMGKPFIAAINGSAMGGGFELALACDIRIVKDGPYDLGLPEVNLGILPGAGGTQRLTRLVGKAKALELMLLGRTVSPREALELGLASFCVEGDVLEEALEVASLLASRSPRAISHIKDLIQGIDDRPVEDGFARERTLFCDLMVDERGLEEMGKMAAGKRDIRDPALARFKRN